MRIRLLAALGLAAALAGCAVGPNYLPPVTPAPGTPGGGGFVAEAPASTQAPPEKWWELYDLPTLDDLVQDALVHNNNLLQAAANLAEARAGRFPSTCCRAACSTG